MSVAVRFTTLGEQQVRGALQGVANEGQKTAISLRRSLDEIGMGTRQGLIVPSQFAEDQIRKTGQTGVMQMKELARATNEVGNQMGLGLHRGLANAGKGLAEAAASAAAYIKGVKASATAT